MTTHRRGWKSVVYRIAVLVTSVFGNSGCCVGDGGVTLLLSIDVFLFFQSNNKNVVLQNVKFSQTLVIVDRYFGQTIRLQLVDLSIRLPSPPVVVRE